MIKKGKWDSSSDEEDEKRKDSKKSSKLINSKKSKTLETKNNIEEDNIGNISKIDNHSTTKVIGSNNSDENENSQSFITTTNHLENETKRKVDEVNNNNGDQIQENTDIKVDLNVNMVDNNNKLMKLHITMGSPPSRMVIDEEAIDNIDQRLQGQQKEDDISFSSPSINYTTHVKRNDNKNNNNEKSNIVTENILKFQQPNNIDIFAVFNALTIEIKMCEEKIKECENKIEIAYNNEKTITATTTIDAKEEGKIYWMKREVQLRDEKKQLRDEKYQLLLLLNKNSNSNNNNNNNNNNQLRDNCKTSQENFRIAEQTWNLLSKGNVSTKDEESKQFINFSGEIQFFNKVTRINNIFIRKDYFDLFDIISNYLSTKVKKRFLITGTPGIGKSTFLYYILWRLAANFGLIDNNKNNEIWSGKKIFVQSDFHKVLYLKENQVITYSLLEASVILDENSLLLVDMVELQEPLLNPGITIVFASPNPARFKQFIKDAMTVVLYMNVWTLEELRYVWNKSYKNDNKVTEEEFINVYNKSGGIIRYVLEQNNIAITKLDEAFQKVIEKGRSIVKFLDSTVARDDQISYTLFHFRYISSDHLQAKLQFASPYVMNCISSIIVQEDLDDIIRFVNSNDHSYMQTTCGRIFEHLFHKLYSQVDIKELRRLPKPSRGFTETEKEFWDKEQQTHGVQIRAFKVNNITFANNIPIEFEFSNLSMIKNNFYYKPRSQTFASIDSFVKNDNNVFLFQITIAKTHSVKEEGLLQIVELFEKIFSDQKLTYHLVFVCPKGTENSSNFRSQKLIESESFIENLKQVPDKLKPFLLNQWIAEVEITDSLISKLQKLECY